MYRITHPVSADDLIDEEDFDRDERLPYWAELWPSAVALARYLSERDLGGTRVIELGCGVGLPTVVALARGARVLATDHYEAALAFTAYNASTNLYLEPEVSALDWRWPDLEGIGTFDLVLAADVLYERKNAAALADLWGDEGAGFQRWDGGDHHRATCERCEGPTAPAAAVGSGAGLDDTCCYTLIQCFWNR
jgi:predicted nicotinamide N-methyase